MSSRYFSNGEPEAAELIVLFDTYVFVSTTIVISIISPLQTIANCKLQIANPIARPGKLNSVAQATRSDAAGGFRASLPSARCIRPGRAAHRLRCAEIAVAIPPRPPRAPR